MKVVHLCTAAPPHGEVGPRCVVGQGHRSSQVGILQAADSLEPAIGWRGQTWLTAILFLNKDTVFSWVSEKDIKKNASSSQILQEFLSKLAKQVSTSQDMHGCVSNNISSMFTAWM